MVDLYTPEPDRARDGGSAVFVIDASGVVRVAEGEALVALGVGPEDATGRLASSLLGTRPRMLAALHRVLAGEPDRLELSINHRSFEVRFEPRTSGGALVLADDVTAKRRLAAEERLAERHLVHALRAIPGVIWTTDQGLRINFIQGRALEACGLLRRRAEGMTVQQLFPDPVDRAVAHHVAALAGTGQSFRYSSRGRTFEVAVEPLRGLQGDVGGCIGTALDVTERSCVDDHVELKGSVEHGADGASETTAALEHSLSIARAALDAAADGLLVVDQQGRIAAYNQRFLALWGIPTDIAEHGDDERLIAFVRTQLLDPDAFVRGVRAVYGGNEHESFDVLHFRDGRVFERYSLPQRVGNQVVGRVWSFRDVTERDWLLRRAEFFADATRLLGSLDVESALDSVAHLVVQDLAQCFAVDLLGDAGVRRLLVLARDDATAGTTPEPPLATLSGHASLYTAGAASCMSVPLEMNAATLGALTFVAPVGRRYTAADLDFAADLARRVALSVENARLYRASQDALRAREEFFSVAAHEIRGPVASMHLAVQGLRQGLLNETLMPKVLDVIEREDRRLTRFVDELLDINKVRTGRLTFTFESVDLAEVVRSVATRFTSELSASQSSLSLAARGVSVGEWDRFRLEQVVTNLLANAVKFGQGKPIEVSVVGHDGHATLIVRDHGVGISRTMLEPIFKPFERAVSSRHYGGLGLGLYIVQAIVRGLGGTVRAESPTTGGASFVVDLPTRRSPGGHREQRS